MTIVPKGMFLLDGKLVNKPQVWPNPDTEKPDEAWSCGYKGSGTALGFGPTREAAYEAWTRILLGPLKTWSKL